MLNHSKRIILFLSAFLLSVFPSFSQSYSTKGMVVSESYLATEVGVKILEKGGNAIDASVATAFALAVTHPTAGNIGGGGFIVYLDSKGEATTIDFREKAPLRSSPFMYLDSKGELITDLNHKSILAIGVPGTVAGLWKAHQKYGKLPWKQLVQPAVDLAENGFPFTMGLVKDLEKIKKSDYQPDFIKKYFLDEKGEEMNFAKIWKQPALARTLKIIRDKGHDGFYKGKVAEEIEKWMKANGGIISKEDLAKYDAIERKPIIGNYRGLDVISMPPPSSGGVTMVEMLNMLENIDMDTLEFNSSKYVHYIAEIMKRAYADRAEYLGDPDFNENMPLDNLLSKEHAKKLYQSIDFSKASISDSSSFNHPYGGDNTTHFSVLDKDGNAVSLTYTLEYSYGSKMGSEKLGFIFNNEMGDFNPVPGLTNSNGLIGTNPNLIAPEKRMLSSMTPTIVAKNGKPYIVLGTPGGRTIINVVFQTLINIVDYNMNSFKAIEAMKIHHQWLPDKIRYEEKLMSPDTVEQLQKMGHKLKKLNNLGRMSVIIYDEKTGIVEGSADSSGPDGNALGVK